MNKHYKYDVAISFAEEDRDVALALEQAFRMQDIIVYYYPNKRVDTLGNLKEKLTSIYKSEARYAVVLLSEHYVNPSKEYVQVELTAIQSRVTEDAKLVYMVLVMLKRSENEKVDPIQHPAFKGQTYLEWNHEPEKIVSVIWEMLGKKKEKDNSVVKHNSSDPHEIQNINSVTNKLSNNNTINFNIRDNRD